MMDIVEFLFSLANVLVTVVIKFTSSAGIASLSLSLSQPFFSSLTLSPHSFLRQEFPGRAYLDVLFRVI